MPSPLPRAHFHVAFVICEAFPFFETLQDCAAAVIDGAFPVLGEALRAARPLLITPFRGEQYFWAAVVDGLGIAAQSLPAERIFHGSFFSAVRHVTHRERGRAAALVALAAMIQAETGTERALRMILQLAMGRKG